MCKWQSYQSYQSYEFKKIKAHSCISEFTEILHKTFSVPCHTNPYQMFTFFWLKCWYQRELSINSVYTEVYTLAKDLAKTKDICPRHLVSKSFSLDIQYERDSARTFNIKGPRISCFFHSPLSDIKSTLQILDRDWIKCSPYQKTKYIHCRVSSCVASSIVNVAVIQNWYRWREVVWFILILESLLYALCRTWSGIPCDVGHHCPPNKFALSGSEARILLIYLISMINL